MIGLVDSVARRLVRRGLRRGLYEGSPMWIAVGAVALLVRLLVRNDEEKVYREELRLGESLVIRHVAPVERGRSARRGSASAPQS